MMHDTTVHELPAQHPCCCSCMSHEHDIPAPGPALQTANSHHSGTRKLVVKLVIASSAMAKLNAQALPVPSPCIIIVRQHAD